MVHPFCENGMNRDVYSSKFCIIRIESFERKRKEDDFLSLSNCYCFKLQQLADYCFKVGAPDICMGATIGMDAFENVFGNESLKICFSCDS